MRNTNANTHTSTVREKELPVPRLFHPISIAFVASINLALKPDLTFAITAVHNKTIALQNTPTFERGIVKKVSKRRFEFTSSGTGDNGIVASRFIFDRHMPGVKFFLY